MLESSKNLPKTHRRNFFLPHLRNPGKTAGPIEPEILHKPIGTRLGWVQMYDSVPLFFENKHLWTKKNIEFGLYK